MHLAVKTDADLHLDCDKWKENFQVTIRCWRNKQKTVWKKWGENVTKTQRGSD